MDISEALRTGSGVTISEALSEGAKVTGLGLMIVFSVLVILMIVLYLFKVIFYKQPKPTKQAEPTPKPVVTQAPVPEIKKQDDDELIAVLTAAVAASLNTTTYNLRIKSYKRISSNATAWQKAGISETINNRF